MDLARNPEVDVNPRRRGALASGRAMRVHSKCLGGLGFRISVHICILGFEVWGSKFGV